MVKDQLKEFLNIEWTLESFEPATGLIKWRDEAFNTAIQGHCYTANVPDSIISDHYRLGGTRNYTDFTDPRIEELFEQQARESDPEERTAILRTLEDYILSDELGTPSVLLMWSWGAPRLVHKSIKNFHGSPSVQAQMMHEHIWWDPSEVKTPRPHSRRQPGNIRAGVEHFTRLDRVSYFYTVLGQLCRPTSPNES